VEHLPRRGLGYMALGRGQRLERGLVGNGAPQKRGNVVLLDALQQRGHAGFPEIFLCEHGGRDLAPAGGNLDLVSQEHHRSVGIADLALGRFKRDRRISGARTLGVVPFDAHKFRFPWLRGQCPTRPPKRLPKKDGSWSSRRRDSARAATASPQRPTSLDTILE